MNASETPKLLLASRSEARRRMLEAAGVPCAIVESVIDETGAKAGLVEAGFEPRDLAEMLAEMKARGAVADRGALVLGADQVLERDDGSTFSKPASKEEAFDQLRALAGRIHYLHSAAVMLRDGERVWGRTETACLRMRRLSTAFIRDYLDREYEAIRWSVGGYRIEGPGIQLFEEIEGSHFVILGLPLLSLLDCLRERGLLAT